MKIACRATLLLALIAVLSVPVLGRGGSRRGDMPRYTDTMNAGDVAFSVPLSTLDGKGTFDLTGTEGKPVALVFGSYT